MDPSNRAGGRIAYVDGLRALAVLLVVAHHVVRHSPQTAQRVPFLSLAHLGLDGSHGVDLFFVLSGYCLSYPFLRRLRASGSAAFDIAGYFAKRIVRIVPPYYTALTLFVAVALFERQPVSAADVVKQLLFLDWHTNFINGSFWTLCVEFRWYFVFPFALLLWTRSPRAFIGVALTATIAYAFTRLHAPDVGTLLPFMLGIVAADIEIRAIRIDPIVWIASPVCVLGALFLETASSMPSPVGTDNALFYVQTNAGWQIVMFLFVLAGGSFAWLRRALSFAPLAAIGTASYSIYLVHEPVVTLLAKYAPLPGVAESVLAYAAAVAAGFAFWVLAERAWTSEPLKGASVARIRPHLERLFRSLDLPQSITAREPDPRLHVGT